MQLATDGFAAVPPAAFPDVIEGCRAQLAATGDGRFAVLADVFAMLEDWWGRTGGVPSGLADATERQLREGIPAVLGAQSASGGTARALQLERELRDIAVPSHVWQARGLIRVGGEQA
ncbi:MAG: hypothetical protein QOJ29_4555 [Thermoleophilaceae bacterium]|nr:hypothetical protein [Thermoleophilaceae bacterium]